MSKIYNIENSKLLKEKSLVIYSDIHYYKNMNLTYLYQELSKLLIDTPDYVILSGDIIDDFTPLKDRSKDLSLF